MVSDIFKRAFYYYLLLIIIIIKYLCIISLKSKTLITILLPQMKSDAKF